MGAGTSPAMSEDARHRLERELADVRAQLETAGQQLIESHKMAALGRLLAGVVHEINTPIGSILSNNEVIVRSLDKLKRELSDTQPVSLERARDILETCRTLASVDKIACERITGIIRGLKTFARVEDTDLRRVDLHESLQNTLKLTHAEFGRRVLSEQVWAWRSRSRSSKRRTAVPLTLRVNRAWALPSTCASRQNTSEKERE